MPLAHWGSASLLPSTERPRGCGQPRGHQSGDWSPPAPPTLPDCSHGSFCFWQTGDCVAELERCPAVLIPRCRLRGSLYSPALPPRSGFSRFPAYSVLGRNYPDRRGRAARGPNSLESHQGVATDKSCERVSASLWHS